MYSLHVDKLDNFTCAECVIGTKFAERDKRQTKFRMLSTNKAFHALILFALGGYAAQAQDPCSISLQNDTTVCQGQSVLLEGPDGFPTYLWNTGANTQDITVASSGNYVLQASYPSGELVTNGNFSAGNTGFTTQFTLNNNLNQFDGTYWIGTNAASHHPQFNGTGTGQFMIVNSGYEAAHFMVWCQEVDVCPQQTYTMSFRARTISNATPARLQWWMDGVPVGPEWNLPVFGSGWQTINQAWTSPPGPTTSNICLRVMSGEGVGNDFGLDDISMSGTIVLSDTVNVSVTPLPVVDFGPDQNLCFGETLTLNANVPGGSYLWQDGSSASTFTVTSAGTYSVTVTANSCSYSESINVGYSGALVVELGPDTTLCSGETLVLDATLPGGATYLWQDGSTNATFTVTTPGSYTVLVSRNGCSASSSIVVGYNPLPVIDLGGDQSICAGEQTTLDATTAGASYLWHDGSTNATFQADAAGTYNVNVTVNGCTSASSMDVTVIPLPVVDLGGDQTVCPGSSVIFDATTAGATYLWQDGNTDPTYTATLPGIYAVTVSVGSCSNSDNATLGNYTPPVVDLGVDQTVCEGQAGNFSVAVPNSSYAWSTGATTAAIAPTTASIYWVDVTRDGCTVRDSVELFVTPLPMVDLGTSPAVCPGTTVDLDATTPGGSYLWSTGETTASISAPPGDYDVEVTATGCSTTASVTVGALPAPTVALGADTTLCAGDMLLLDVSSPGASYLWASGETTATLSVNVSGTYSVVLTGSNGCSGSDAIEVDFVTPVPVDLGADITACQGDLIELDATTPGATYLWNTGATTATLSLTVSGTYSVDVTQGSCMESGSIEITLQAAPVIDLGTQSSICPGESLLLDATSNGATYLWNTGAVTPTLDVSEAGTYSVVVTNAANCSADASITITEVQPGLLDLGGEAELCIGGSLTLDATLPGSTYVWSTGATTAILDVSDAGSYWVDVTQSGCSLSDTISVTVVDPGTIDLGADTSLCVGESLVLDATLSGATYLWNDGSVLPTLSASTSGTYSVQATVGQCEVSDVITLTFQPLPVVDLGADVSLCAGTTTTFDATTVGGSYLWSDGSTGPTLVIGDAGAVSVVVTVAGCSTTSEAIVSVVPSPQPTLGADTMLCVGATLLLNATEPGSTYLWDNGETTPTRLISEAGTYWVSLERNACLGSDTITVSYFDPAVLDLGADVVLCSGGSTTLTTGLIGVLHLWNTGATGTAITVSTTGLFWVEAQVAGCEVRDSVLVTLVDLIQPDLGPDRTICSDEELVLSVDPGSADVLWTTGSTAAAINVVNTGTYGVTLSKDGCSVSDQVNITVTDRIEELELPATVELCPSQTVLLDVGDVGTANILWSTGSTSPSLLVREAGTYLVQVTGACVDASASVQVIAADCSPTIYVPNAFTADGNGINDLFVPVLAGPVDDYRMEIFNRWGEQLFSTKEPGVGWDGSYGGVETQDGVYIWVLTYTEFTEMGRTGRRMMGHVTLFR